MQNKNLRKLILDELKNSKAVEVDYDNHKIKYSKELSLERSIEKITGDEELVRAYLVHKLSKFDYQAIRGYFSISLYTILHIF
jgi:hypothetical protein